MVSGISTVLVGAPAESLGSERPQHYSPPYRRKQYILISSPHRVKLARAPIPVYHRRSGFEANSYFGESITADQMNGLMLRRASLRGLPDGAGGGAIAL